MAPENKIKAAFLYNFAKLCEWPTNAFPTASTPLIIAVLGDDPFGAVLDQIVDGRRIDGRKVAVRRFARVEEVVTCHVLYLSESAPADLPATLAALAGRPILTVGESELFARSGGIIRLVKRDQVIGFEVCPRAATAGQLKLSSKLLALARIACPPRREEIR